MTEEDPFASWKFAEPEEQCCFTCRFASVMVTGSVECHRYAPKPGLVRWDQEDEDSRPSFEAEWPRLPGEEFCGEHDYALAEEIRRRNHMYRQHSKIESEKEKGK